MTDNKIAEYALLKAPSSNLTTTQHGAAIDLGRDHPDLASQPLQINGQPVQSHNPDRYKQHGFHFNADNCIACHACESACSEKNNLAPHLAFRKVGFIEGGTYPDTLRLNISMACNHCDDPVCLKGCPTLAYTKYVEYGAVLQDPNICFGCGYCTWVCPYNAPQLDLSRGQVEKCNMCVDRLEAGLKPACVSACLSHALDFGVIEDIPKGQKQAKLTLPGFPDPNITRPNIRFQQTRSLPQEFTRGDREPIRYYRDKQDEEHYKVGVSQGDAKKEWGFSKLRSREDTLVGFTLISQGVIGAFCLWFLATFFGAGTNAVPGTPFLAHPVAAILLLFGILTLQTAALVVSTLHLGKPQFFYRALNNLRYSWVSREMFTMGIFYHMLGAFTLIYAAPFLISWLPELLVHLLPSLLGWGAMIAGVACLCCMGRIYRIKARPFWDHGHVYGAFFSSALILGGLTVGFLFGVAESIAGQTIARVLPPMARVVLLGLIVQGVSLFAHWRYLNQRGAEAAVSRMYLMTTFGKTYIARWISWGILTTFSLLVSILNLESVGVLIVWGIMIALAFVHEVVGRMLFYVAVVPTTHPGAFFFGNNVFATHARKVGLADMPQTGVLPNRH